MTSLCICLTLRITHEQFRASPILPPAFVATVTLSSMDHGHYIITGMIVITAVSIIFSFGYARTLSPFLIRTHPIQF